MRIKYLVLYLLVGAGLLTGCAPTIEPPVDKGYNYIPIDTGRYYIYNVDSIYIDYTANPYILDTFHYQVKEFYPYTFTDAMSETAICCTRYYRSDSTQTWQVTSGTNVWWIKRTNTRFEKREENLTFVKMTYPIDISYTWDGNAYNNLGPQTYYYGTMDANFYGDTYHGPMDVNFHDGPLLFDSTITVFQSDPSDTNQIEYFYLTETYRRNIGMVNKVQFRIPTLFSDTTSVTPWIYPGVNWPNIPKLKRIKTGSMVTYNLIENGFE